MRFSVGKSGNPLGRPVGALGTLTKRRAVLVKHLPEIVIAMKQLSNFGDAETLKQRLKMAIEDKIL